MIAVLTTAASMAITFFIYKYKIIRYVKKEQEGEKAEVEENNKHCLKADKEKVGLAGNNSEIDYEPQKVWL